MKRPGRMHEVIGHGLVAKPVLRRLAAVTVSGSPSFITPGCPVFWELPRLRQFKGWFAALFRISDVASVSVILAVSRVAPRPGS
jgi:hypothetical protein